jgi:hypothetical protein
VAKASLNLSPLLMTLRDEAERIGVSFPATLTTDLARYRWLAERAVPSLTVWQWGLLSHVLGGIEAHGILTGNDSLPSIGSVIAEIETWCDGATDDDILRAGVLTKKIQEWTPLAIAGVLLRMRREP